MANEENAPLHERDSWNPSPGLAVAVSENSIELKTLLWLVLQFPADVKLSVWRLNTPLGACQSSPHNHRLDCPVTVLQSYINARGSDTDNIVHQTVGWAR